MGDCHLLLPASVQPLDPADFLMQTSDPNMNRAAAKGSQALGTEAGSNGKRQKRAPLTAVTLAETLPTITSSVSNQETYAHLLHWNRNKEDEIIEWDKEDWGQDGDEEDEDNEGASPVQDTIEDAQSPTEGLEYSDLDVAETAIRQATQQPHVRAGKIPMENVIKIINDSMEAFANEWSPSKDPDFVPENGEQLLDPVRLWEDAEALGRRDGLVEKYKFEIQNYENKLDTLAAEICKIPQNSEKQVRQHCRNLEMHVHNLEAAKWHLSIYEIPPVDSEHNSAEEQHTPTMQGSVQQHDAEVIDLGSSSEASESGDDREMVVGAEEQAVTKTPSETNPAVRFSRCTVCGYKTKRKDEFEYHLEHEHKGNRAAAGKAIDAAGTVPTPHQGSDIEMDLDKPSSVAPVLILPRRLELTRIRSTAPESGMFSSIEPGETPFPPATRNVRRSRPEIASIMTVSGWVMRDLVGDEKKVVMKVMLEMSRQDREMIHNRIRAIKKSNLLKEISTCIDMLCRKEQKMLGVLPSDLPKIKAITRFFLCWYFKDDYMHRMPTDEQLHDLATEPDRCDDFEMFYTFVHWILHNTFSEEAFRNAHRPSDEEEPPARSPRALQKKPTPKRVQAQRKPQDDIIMLD
jgi:hypothetical protein